METLSRLETLYLTIILFLLRWLSFTVLASFVLLLLAQLANILLFIPKGFRLHIYHIHIPISFNLLKSLIIIYKLFKCNTILFLGWGYCYWMGGIWFIGFMGFTTWGFIAILFCISSLLILASISYESICITELRLFFCCRLNPLWLYFTIT